MKNKLQPKINRFALGIFDGLLDAVTKIHGEINIEGQVIPIDGNKTGIIFSSDDKPVQAFTVDRQGKVRQATIKVKS